MRPWTNVRFLKNDVISTPSFYNRAIIKPTQNKILGFIITKRMVFFFGSFSFILQVLTYPILGKGPFFTKKMKKPGLIEEEIFRLKLPTSGKKKWVIIRP